MGMFLVYVSTMPVDGPYGRDSRLITTKQLKMPGKSLPLILLLWICGEADVLLQSENKEVCEILMYSLLWLTTQR